MDQGIVVVEEEDLIPFEVKKVSPLKNLLAGGFGGMCLVTIGHPMDTIKVRLQTQGVPLPGEKPAFTGFVDCLQKTVSKEGFRGLYKGMATPFAFSTVLTAVSFWGYRMGRTLQGIPEQEQPEMHQAFIAGMFSGAVGSVICGPADRIKCLLQVQRADPKNARYSGPVDCAVSLYKEQGIRKGIYRGTVATLLRDLPGLGTYFFIYEYVLRNIMVPGAKRSDCSPALILLAGGSAGVASWFVSIPFDTVKSRLQTSHEGGFLKALTNLVRQEGPTALYKGLTPVLLRAFPACAASFLGYEMAMNGLNYIAPSW